MSATATALSAYASASASTASPHEIVRMAYERVLTACDRSTAASTIRSSGWIQTFHDETVRAQAILAELMSVLAIDHVDEAVSSLSRQLDDLYSYCIAQLVDANLAKDPTPLKAVHMVIDGLHDAWVNQEMV
jgi:flagellar biosynthetic protein FliS